MKTTANEPLPRFQRLGMTLVINFDETPEEVTDDNGKTYTRYHYLTAKVKKTATSDQRVEAIIATRYPTYGAELAAINNGGQETDDYRAFRAAAKQLAKESFAQ